MITILGLLFVSVAGMAREKVADPSTSIAINTGADSNSPLNTLTCFMGTKQNTNSNEVKEANSKIMNVDERCCPKLFVSQNFFEESDLHASNIA